VSGNADVDSDEWKRAVKVRKAMIMAIDREAIRDTILGGYVRLGTLRGFRRWEHLLGGREWEYNPDKARQLMAEAGYADGFRINLAPTIRNAPGEIALCEAIASMWNDELGLDVKIQRVAWSALVPQFRGRTFVGSACQGASSKVAVPGVGTVLLSNGKHSHGATHPFIEDILPRITSEPDDAKRNAMEAEYGAFLMDNALAETALFYGDIVWPVGPKIEEWKDQVNAMDMRSIGGYEFIQHRR
jgi:ABC-type transport system substrate-binding protein